MQRYGFVPNATASIFQNAMNLRACATNLSCNLPIPTNMAFHNLTEDQSAPPEAKLLMGLGDKFIPVPDFTNEFNVECGIARFERSFMIKVIYTPGEEDNAILTCSTSRIKKLSCMLIQLGLLATVMYPVGSPDILVGFLLTLSAAFTSEKPYPTSSHSRKSFG